MMFLYNKHGITPSISTYYDVEYYDYMSKQMYQDIIETYIGYTISRGVQTKVYANKNFAQNLFNEKTRSYVDWIAHYTNNQIEEGNPGKLTNYIGSWRGWQYTSKGKVPGISGYVDKNIFLY